MRAIATIRTRAHIHGIGFVVAAGIVMVVAMFAAIAAPLAGAALLAAALLVAILSVAPHRTSVALLLLALPFTRPFILSEASSQVGIVLAVAAAVAAIADDENCTPKPRMQRPDKIVLGFTAALWLWMLVLLALRPIPTIDTVKSIFSVVVLLLAALIVLRDPDRRRAVTKAIVVAVLVSAALYCVTLSMWFARGFGSGMIASVDLGIQHTSTGIAFPFTPTYGTQALAGRSIPRFLGLGREAGVGSVLLAWTYFMLPRVGLTKRLYRFVALVALFGTLSTAGFALFVVVWVSDRMLLHSGPPRGLATLRQWAGVGALAGAVWLAVYAPFLGVAQKSLRDPVSAGDRTAATKLGLTALTHTPFGRELSPSELPTAAINIMASAVTIGVIGVTLSILAMLMPLLWSRAPRLASAPVAIVLGNALFAQPALQSTAYLIMIALACWQPSDVSRSEDPRFEVPRVLSPVPSRPVSSRLTREPTSTGMPASEKPITTS